MKKSLVLVVEDYEDARVLYEECLSQAGFRVMSADNGLDGVALAANEPPDAIVMDFHMPGMDGWEAIRRIRALGIEPRPFIVAITAHVGARARSDAHEAGADEFLAKPADPDALCALVTAALRARGLG